MKIYLLIIYADTVKRYHLFQKKILFHEVINFEFIFPVLLVFPKVKKKNSP